MNKVFKVKWNSSLQRFDITSELTKGKSKFSSGNSKKTGVQLRHAGILSMAALAMGLTAPSMAAEIEVDAFDSKDGGHVQSITGNDKLISSSWNNIAAGDPGYIRMSVREAILQGKLRDLDSGATLADLDKGNLVTGQMVGYDYYDANIGNVATFQGYNNNELKMANVLDSQSLWLMP
jgi:autotransporter family porin